MSELVRLNLGCGRNKMAGYVNVDKYGDPDVRHDLEVLPWPFATGSVGEVWLNHVLEHLGQLSGVFLGIMQELYRVCAAGCLIHIVVPHPRHDDFLGDPTHVRAITPESLQLFSMKNCIEWERVGAANSPLGRYLNVDFELVEHQLVVDEPYWARVVQKQLTQDELQALIRERNNIAKEWRMTLQVVKPARGERSP